MIAIRASSLGRRCGVFSALSESLPRTAGQTEAMARGTQIHADIEASIKSRPKDPLHEVIRSLGYTTASESMFSWMTSDSALGPLLAPTSAEVSMAAVVSGAVLHGTIDGVEIRESKYGGHVVVVDWKTGQCGGLPPIFDDRQMRAYAHLAGDGYGMPVYVMRVQLDTGFVNVLDLRSDDAWSDNRITVESAVAWHVEHHGQPASDRATCASCPIRAHCRHYCAGVVQAVPELSTITNHDGVPVIATDEDARRVAMVLRPARAALDRLEQELRAWVSDRGAVEDTGRARTWGHALRMRDVISDHAALLAELASETDDGRAWSTAATTKTGVLRALMDGGLTRPEALAWWEVRREMGLISKQATDVWGWSDE